MTTAQTAAVAAFLATLTEGQRAALLDCVATTVENMECADDFEEGSTLVVPFLTALQDATIETINA